MSLHTDKAQDIIAEVKTLAAGTDAELLASEGFESISALNQTMLTMATMAQVHALLAVAEAIRALQ